MAKVLVIYDSKTGHTEKMAKTIADGWKGSEKGVDVDLKKLGTPFPLSILDQADAIMIGFPNSVLAHVTEETRLFMDAVEDLKVLGRLKLNDKDWQWLFGSDGWDGGWNLEELKADMKKLGIRIERPVLESVDSPSDRVLKECTDLGKTIAEELTKKK